MAFELSINNILRLDLTEQLQIGKEYSFEKQGLHLVADTIQIWLTKKDWTVLADIQITKQIRSKDTTQGTFIVKYIYTGQEQTILTNIFKRMYGW